MDFAQLFHDFLVNMTAENLAQMAHQIAFDGHTQFEVAHGDETGIAQIGAVVFQHPRTKTRHILRQRCIQIVEQPLPALTYGLNVFQGIAATLTQQFFARQILTHLINRQFLMAQIGF